MCGIAGFIETAGGRPGGPDLLVRMTRALAHRGPDDEGAWFDRDTGVALGHRRLAIVDLSPVGHQPMHSADGRYVIVYNGEVYNFRTLRQELERGGVTFRGSSDTEVIVEAIARFGLDATVERLIGMFAFAVWDRRKRELHLVRDRMGIKPLYYGRVGGRFVFGSELKALRAAAEGAPDVDREALASLMRYGYIGGGRSIYQGVRKLPPGSRLRLPLSAESLPEPTAYWSVAEVVHEGETKPFGGTPDEAVAHLHGLLRDAVGRRMVADVPVGAFLSGGIDSSTVVALMQEQSREPVRTYSIGFREAGYNEAERARRIAGHLGTDHTELYVSPHEAQEVIPRLAELYDEPYGDSSAIPTALVSSLARRDVTVSLSGDGGDELFFGYKRYFDLIRLWRRIGWVPVGARRLTGRFVALGRTGGGGRRRSLAEMLDSEDMRALYQWRISHWRDPAALLAGVQESASERAVVGAGFESWARHMMAYDQTGYLPEDILTKVDRASMAVALEARVPLLDHRVVEFAWTMPAAWKVQDGKGKWPLRQILHRYVPDAYFEGPKRGFSVPVKQWLCGPLRDWAEALLDESRLRREGFFLAERVRREWDEHLRGGRDNSQRLWNVLMFQMWLERWGWEEAAQEPGRSVEFA